MEKNWTREHRSAGRYSSRAFSSLSADLLTSSLPISHHQDQTIWNDHRYFFLCCTWWWYLPMFTPIQHVFNNKNVANLHPFRMQMRHIFSSDVSYKMLCAASHGADRLCDSLVYSTFLHAAQRIHYTLPHATGWGGRTPSFVAPQCQMVLEIDCQFNNTSPSPSIILPARMLSILQMKLRCDNTNWYMEEGSNSLHYPKHINDILLYYL